MSQASVDQEEVVCTPEEPHPSASSQEVQRFLVQTIRTQDYRCTEDEAVQLASNLRVDGKHLYLLSEEKLTKELGLAGGAVFNSLRRGKYGFRSGIWPLLSVVGALLGVGCGTAQVWWFGGTVTALSIVFTLAATFIGVLSIYCRTKWFCNSKWVPRGLKIRTNEDIWMYWKTAT